MQYRSIGLSIGDKDMVVWVIRTAQKKKEKIEADNPNAEYKLVKEHHKKDQLIQLLEEELYGHSNPSHK